jgi:hypothetical protein
MYMFSSILFMPLLCFTRSLHSFSFCDSLNLFLFMFSLMSVIHLHFHNHLLYPLHFLITPVIIPLLYASSFSHHFPSSVCVCVLFVSLFMPLLCVNHSLHSTSFSYSPMLVSFMCLIIPFITIPFLTHFLIPIHFLTDSPLFFVFDYHSCYSLSCSYLSPLFIFTSFNMFYIPFCFLTCSLSSSFASLPYITYQETFLAEGQALNINTFMSRNITFLGLRPFINKKEESVNDVSACK